MDPAGFIHIFAHTCSYKQGIKRENFGTDGEDKEGGK